MANGRGKSKDAGSFSEHPGHGSAGKTAQSHELNKVDGYGREAAGQLGSPTLPDTSRPQRASWGT